MRRLLGFTIFALLLVLTYGGTAFAGGACPSSVPSGVTSCYFIDAVGGNDSNAGTSEASPWQHAPSMANAASTSAAHTPGPGEGWIFKGGVTWGPASWPMNIIWGGTSGARDYMGVDPSWYAGSAWARPIFNGGGSSGFNADSNDLIGDFAHQASYLVLDNIEFTGLYWDGGGCNVNNPYGCGYIATYGFTTNATNWELKNLYIHGWSHNSGSFYDPANGQEMVWLGDQFAGSSFHDSVINGSDTTADCCGAIGGGAAIYNDDFEYLYNVFFGEYPLIHDNRITNMVAPSLGNNSPHGNCVHLFGPMSVTMIVYNNWVNCSNNTTNDEMNLIEENNAQIYEFNNVFTQDGHGIIFSDSTFTGGPYNDNYYLWNNTAECGPDPTPTSTCIGLYSGTTTTASDNLWITNNNNQPTIQSHGGASNFPSPLVTVTCSAGPQSNTGGNQLCAPIGSGNGTGNLNLTETYPFAPLDAAAATTVGTGQNNAANCAVVAAINAAAGTACLSDTTTGIVYNAATKTVSWPARTPVARPVGPAWRNGAYEFNSSSAGLPNPPTNLTAVVD